MEITFINNFVSTRGGFRHETLLSIDSTIVRKSVCRYLNRTWESYPYQSVMKYALDEEIDAEIERMKDAYRLETGRKRVSKDLVFTNDYVEALRKKRSTL